MEKIVTRIEVADAKGDSTEIDKCVNILILRGTTHRSNPTQPTHDKEKKMIQSPEELGDI